ncbi:hypothetical protein FIBSPDRAFT_1053990 [Athelia psychrophila]|uniref:MI domain-containing protein n=1 Tax=Athelia psychrophila TaxID=1759441 RepID=A0A167W306_9AGAM|nr:hypothetical protein FIBSPDRAFT_1053990 [Fibularhizoctonia sp. CBS 109695]
MHAAATLSRNKAMASVLRILHISNVSHCLTVQPTAEPPTPSTPRSTSQYAQQQQQPMPVPGWPGRYYQQDPYMQQAYYPQQWYMPGTPIPQQQHMPPQFHPHPPGMPMSPRNPQMPLQPGTPTQSPALTHQPPHANNDSSNNTLPGTNSANRLSTYANTFVPNPPRSSKISIKAADGSEASRPAVPPASGFNRTANGHRSGKSQSIRMESEEARQKRVAEEEAKAHRERAVKEAEEKVKKDAEEKVQREEEARVAAIKKAAEDEAERIRKDEEERIRKEAEEAERVKAEQQAEADKAREEAAAAQKAAEDAERAKEEEAVAAAAAVTAAATAATAKEKEEGEVAESPSELISDKRKSGLSINTAGPSQEARKPRPGSLDLSYGKTPITPGLPSALATARIIEDIEKMEYPEGIMSPKLELNVNAKDGKFKYDRDFLRQFMSICKEKPDQLPPLDAIGLEPVDQFSMSRGGSGRHRTTSMQMGPPGPRAGSIGLGIGNFAKPGGSFSMGNFATPGETGKSSEERFAASNRAVSVGGAGAPAPFGRPSPMVRTSSQGGGGPMGTNRTRSKRGEKRTDSNKAPGHQQHGSGYNQQQQMGVNGMHLEPVAPLEVAANRWTAGVPGKKVAVIDPDSPEMVDRKVKGLLNKLTMKKFDSISDQIITWANKSETEKDGRTLIQVIRLGFEKATDEAAWSEMYARLCRKMMEKISAFVQDDGIKDDEGKPIAGGFRAWLGCERRGGGCCQSRRGHAIKAANDKNKDAPGDDEPRLYSEEYYAASKAKRQGLGLIKFIGELFKLQMLTERIVHECLKKLLGNVENPEEEEIESLCKLLSTVGALLDTPKARAHMDVYFSRMKELTRSGNDVVELRDRKWNTRNVVAAPTTLAAVHDLANKDRAAAERESAQRMNSMSRTGSQRGGERGQYDQQGPDGWTVTGESGGRGNPRPPPKAGDLSNFGKINKAAPMTFGPTSVFAKGKEGAKGPRTEPISRSSSSSNMFSMLSQNSEIAADASGPKPTTSRPASRKTSIDLGTAGVAEAPLQRRKLQLLPRSKMTQDSGDGTAASAPVSENGEVEESGTAADSMPEEFFAVRNWDKAENYFQKLTPEHRFRLVDKLVNAAIESKAVDAQLVSDFFARAHSTDLCSEASFEEGFMPIAELLDDIAIDAPKAFDLMAVMVKGASLSEDARGRIAAKSVDSEKLLALLST